MKSLIRSNRMTDEHPHVLLQKISTAWISSVKSSAAVTFSSSVPVLAHWTSRHIHIMKGCLCLLRFILVNKRLNLWWSKKSNKTLKWQARYLWAAEETSAQVKENYIPLLMKEHRKEMLKELWIENDCGAWLTKHSDANSFASLKAHLHQEQ